MQAPLSEFVVIEFAFDPIGCAMEEVYRAPKQFLEVGLEARVGQRHYQGIENVGDAGCNYVTLRKRSRIWFVFERTVTVELQFLEDVISWGRCVLRSEVGVVLVAHGGFLRRIGRAHRGLHGDEGDSRSGLAPAASAQGRNGVEDGEARLFCLAMERPEDGVPCGSPHGVEKGRRKIAGRSHCRSGPAVARSPSGRPWAGPFPTKETP
ncbi:hypothetical protein AU467_24205 [Mesorhizobium loti]|uniref:Uncharacterized protein n=1 Tax=Rhizobium loti TaxID=381 RepID=A0A117N3D7_RHILI|nr:hypothetical protein AU467_24205 [Mesorhizobium loti]